MVGPVTAIARDGHLAAEIADLHGLGARRITAVLDSGWTNHVHVVHSPEPTHVIRFAIDAAAEDRVEVEAWALTRAAAHGIPSPRVVATGELHGVPYLVQEFVAGARGPDRRSLELWRALGAYTRALPSIPVDDSAPGGLFSRFGRHLPEAWRSHVEYNLDQLTGDDPLLRLGVYGPGQQPCIRDRITALADRDLTLGLAHGDVSLNNVLVPDAGPPVLIDWGSATTGPAPWDDVVAVRRNRVRDGTTDQEWAAFADGCGVTPYHLATVVDELTLLSCLDLVRWALDRAPDRLDDLVTAARSHLGADPASR